MHRRVNTNTGKGEHDHEHLGSNLQPESGQSGLLQRGGPATEPLGLAAWHMVSIPVGLYTGSGADLQFQAGEQTVYSSSTAADVSIPYVFFRVERPAISIAQELCLARYCGSLTTFFSFVAASALHYALPRLTLPCSSQTIRRVTFLSNKASNPVTEAQ